jgi:anti-sigma regulatory factor (Ser/Thr protein kinase)
VRGKQLTFRGRVNDLIVLRAELGTLLHAEGWTEEQMSDVLVVADELATNAVVHARTPFDVHCVVDGHVELAVADRDGQHFPFIRPLDDGALGGYGLRIVQRVAGAWTVDRSLQGKVIRVVLDLPRPERSSTVVAADAIPPAPRHGRDRAAGRARLSSRAPAPATPPRRTATAAASPDGGPGVSPPARSAGP